MRLLGMAYFQKRSMSAKRFRILMADDSEDDRFLFARALRKTSDLELAHEVENGEEAIAYLRGDAHYGDRGQHPYPDLLLLDLKMPRVDGFDVLSWMREAGCKPVSVVVFSSSPLPQDVRKALELGADSYQLKPRHIEDFPVLIEKLRFLARSRQAEKEACPACGAARDAHRADCHP
jgi:CheY-like chemotaxis protein